MEIRYLRLKAFYTFLFIQFAVPSGNIHLGVMLPTSRPGFSELGRALELVIAPAIQHVYNHSRLSGQWNITYTVKDSACHKTVAIGKTYELHTADAFIGPACSDSCLSAGLLASYWNKPMISYSCSSVELSNRLFYPTFARTQPFSRTYSRETPDILLQLIHEGLQLGKGRYYFHRGFRVDANCYLHDRTFPKEQHQCTVQGVLCAQFFVFTPCVLKSS